MNRFKLFVFIFVFSTLGWMISAETTRASQLFPTVGINGEICEFNTIRDAIDAATDGDKIYVGVGNYFEQLGVISKTLTFLPANIPTMTDGGCKSELTTATSSSIQVLGDGVNVADGGIAHINNGATVTFRHMQFRNTTATAERGGIFAVTGNESELILDDVNVLDGTATEDGGGIHVSCNFAATCTLRLINDSNVYRNTAAGNGGGIYLHDGTLYATAANIGLTSNATYLNQATNGGGIYAFRGDVTIDGNSIVQRNEASGNGGGLYLDETELVLQDSLIFDNKAIAGEGNGGGIWFELSTFSTFQPPVLIDVTIAENVALNNGGGIYQDVHYVGADIDYTITRGEIRDNTAVNGEGGGAYLYLSGESETTLNNVMVKSNFAHSDGGGIYAEMLSPATLTVSSGGILSNTATTGYGGGIRGYRGTVSVSSAEIIGNKANLEGGGIYGWDTSVICSNSDFEKNSVMNEDNAISYGGAVSLELGDTSTYFNCDFRENSSGGPGGALFDTGSVAILISSGVFEDNLADPPGNFTAFGGAIGATRTDLIELDDVTLRNNESKRNGGAIGADNRTVLIVRNSDITRNDAQDGGAIYCSRATVTVEDSEITFNKASDDTRSAVGGAMLSRADCQTTVLRTTISNNSADLGGGIHALVDGFVAQFVTGDASLSIDDTTIDGNRAYREGGAIYLTGLDDSPGSTALIKNSEIINNTARESDDPATGPGDGGGIFADSVLVQIENVSLRDNDAQNDGGGLYSKGATVRFTSNPATCDSTALAANRYCSEMIGNEAGGDGGAIFVQGQGDNASTSVQSIIGVGNTALISNEATRGAAVYVWQPSFLSLQTTVMMTNALVATNQHRSYSSSSSNLASAIELYDDTVLIARSSTIANNFGKALEVHDTVATVNVLNSILYANIEGPSVPTGVVLGTSCNISQLPDPGTLALGTFADPQFTFTARGNFRLASGSTAVDACDDGPATDLDDFGRPGGSRFDRGAFERNGVPTAVTLSNRAAEGQYQIAAYLMGLVLVGVTPRLWFRPKRNRITHSKI